MQNNRGNFNSGRGGFNQGNRQGGGFQRSEPQKVSVPEKKKFDPKKDYVAVAEQTLGNIANDRRCSISTSKIRNFLSMVSTIYDKELRNTKPELLESSKSALQLMRIRLAYECGRDSNTKNFVEKTDLISYLKGVETKEEFMIYAHYVEAIIAYHRFFGGKE